MNEQVLVAMVDRFEALEMSLNQLDAATGDGDHGTTMLKGLRAAAENSDDPVKSFRRAAGGASGSLFSVIIGALNQVMNNQESLPDALSAACDRITQLGQAVAGDKTMLDALIPASGATTVGDAAATARAGCAATIDMAAKRGRARYVEGAGIGHIDAGATSVAELLQVVADFEADCSKHDMGAGR